VRPLLAEDCPTPGFYERLLTRKQTLKLLSPITEIDPNPANWIEDDEYQVKKSKLNINFPYLMGKLHLESLQKYIGKS